MFLIVESGGKQYKIEKDSTVKVDKLDVDEGGEVVIDKVLVVFDDGGLKAGKPYIEGVTVKAKVLRNGREKKIEVFKQKIRKGHRKLRGHRQHYTLLKIEDIGGL